MTEVTNRKSVITESAGPSSYTTGGFNIEVPELSTVAISKVIEVTGGYSAEVVSTSGNTAKVKVYYYNYPATAAGAATEVAAGVDISSVTITLLSYGL